MAPIVTSLGQWVSGVCERVVQSLSSDEAAGGDRLEPDSDGQTRLPTFSGESHAPSDLVRKSGYTPEVYVEKLLDERGQIAQKSVAELSGLSSSTTSRLLTRMENEQTIRRVQIGGKKVVVDPDDNRLFASARAMLLSVLLTTLEGYAWLSATMSGTVSTASYTAFRTATWAWTFVLKFVTRFVDVFPRFP